MKINEKSKSWQRKKKSERLSEKSCQKTSNKIVALLKKNAKITQNEIAKTLGISRQAVQKHLANLKLAGRLQRIGPDKGGHWEVLGWGRRLASYRTALGMPIGRLFEAVEHKYDYFQNGNYRE